jgi:hypothetical protein
MTKFQRGYGIMDLALLRELAIKRRQELNRKLYELSQGRVLTGPIKGMQLAFHDLVNAGDFTPLRPA